MIPIIPVVYLFNLEILDGIDAVPGALEVYFVSSNTVSREADHDTANLVTNYPQNLSIKVPVVLGVNCHRVLNDVVKLFHSGFNSLLGTYKFNNKTSFINEQNLTNDGNAFSVSILGSWEDDIIEHLHLVFKLLPPIIDKLVKTLIIALVFKPLSPKVVDKLGKLL